MTERAKFYRVVITAPDGRFGQKVIEGGLDLKTARWEAKKYKNLGMVVSIQESPSENRLVDTA